LLQDLPIKIPWQSLYSYSGMHLYVIRLQLDKIDKTHSQVFQDLRYQNIGVNLHYIPVHNQPFYQKMGFNKGDFPEAERYYSEAISLPMYSSLSDLQQDKVVQALESALK
jgi:dTDP-4-amino-4,6-dideoxygalactose transaminase